MDDWMHHTPSYFQGVPIKTTTYYLAICAIFKNEGHILAEWLDHYIREGVDHFYLIDNGSTDDYLPSLAPYQDKITLFHDPERHKQIDHYNTYVLPHLKESEWWLVVDLDEFVYARKGFKTIPAYLSTLPENIAIVRIAWKIFGSNGQEQQPAQVIQALTRRAIVPHPYPGFQYIKSLSRGRRITKIRCHECLLSGGISIWSNGSPTPLHGEVSVLSPIEDHALHLNHYVVQSRVWFFGVKAVRGDASWAKYDTIRDKEYFEKYDRNEVVDDELATKRYA